VGVGPDRYPLRLRQIGAQGPDVDEPDACVEARLDVTLQQVAPLTSGLHLTVLFRHTTEPDVQLGVAGGHRPRGVVVLDAVVGVAQHGGHDHLGGRQAVGVHLHRGAADQREEPALLALSGVGAPGGGPSVGAAVDRLIAIPGADPIQLCRGEVEGGVPVDLDEGLHASKVCRGPWTILQPAPPYRRSPYAERMIVVEQRLPDRRRVGITWKGVDGRDPVALRLQFVGTPMGQCRMPGHGRRVPRMLRHLVGRIDRTRDQPSGASPWACELRSSPTTIPSERACQEASMMFWWTPTVPHDSVWLEVSSNTRTVAPDPSAASSTRTR